MQQNKKNKSKANNVGEQSFMYVCASNNDNINIYIRTSAQQASRQTKGRREEEQEEEKRRTTTKTTTTY